MTLPAEIGELVAPAGCHVVSTGSLDPDARVAIVASRYHAAIVQRMLDGAVAEIEGRGIVPDRITVAICPGAFELGLAAKRFAEARRYAAVIALGCVIRGGTPHFEYVCAETARSLTMTQHETGVPIAFGLLTCDTLQQAEDRAGGPIGNKGQEAAAAALDLAGMLRHLRTA